MFHDKGGVDRHADLICQRRIAIGLFEGMEFPVLDIAKSGREALADQAEQRKNMIAGATGIREQLLDLQYRVVVEQAVEHIVPDQAVLVCRQTERIVRLCRANQFPSPQPPTPFTSGTPMNRVGFPVRKRAIAYRAKTQCPQIILTLLWTGGGISDSLFGRI